MVAQSYRVLLRDRHTRRLLAGLGVSSLGDGLSIVTIAWLAVRTAPSDELGLFVGLAVAAYSLPGAVGAVVLGSWLRRWPARALVLAYSLLRAGCLAAIAALTASGALAPAVYIALIACSSLLASWGNAGEFSLLGELGGESGRLAANSLASAQASLATIVGPVLAGLLLAAIAPGWLLAFDAASFAFLGVQAWRTQTTTAASLQSVDGHAADSGFRFLRRHGLVSLIALTWAFYFLYGPVEAALPVYVAHDLHAHARLLGVYWTSFGVGALTSTLLTGTLRTHATRPVILFTVAGWGACLIPFAFAPVGVTVVCFAIGGLIYGPFVPLNYALFQSLTTPENLPSVLAARSAALIVSMPLGIAIGGPIVATIGAGWTLTTSGTATVLLAAGATVFWRGEALRPAFQPQPPSSPQSRSA